MTTDIEYAAKAAGIEIVWNEDKTWCFIPSAKSPHNRRAEDEMQGVIWNPRTDDGDSRRLQVKLRIDVKCVYGCWIAEHDDISASVIGCGDIEGDDLRAAREAVFQVAVAIGKEMDK